MNWVMPATKVTGRSFSFFVARPQRRPVFSNLFGDKAVVGVVGYLLDVLQNHVAVTIECLDSGKELPVVSAADKDLSVVLDGLLED